MEPERSKGKPRFLPFCPDLVLYALCEGDLPMLNLAMNKPALQSSTSIWSSSSNPEEDARGANNGQISRLYGFHTAYESSPWWQVDLQDEFVIRRVVLYNRQACAERLKYFSILKSLDGEKWHVIFRKRDRSVFGLIDDLPYVAEISGDHLARYVRIRLDGVESLHFSECQVFGEPAEADIRQRIIEDAARAEQERLELPPGRSGKLIEVDDFMVFVDHANYAPEIIATLESGWYEGRERWLAKEILEPGDRVIEAGTAVGLVAMTAALIVGAANVLTFDANPEIVADAQRNFNRNRLGEIKSRWGVLKNRQSIHGENETADFYIAKHFWASRLHASEHDENILKKVQVPVFCLEDEIEVHRANVLICDIEGGEVDLLMQSDLTGIRKIIIETHYGFVGESETDEMMRKLISDGFSIHLGLSGQNVTTLRR
jgi:FkbM family methyltransferase